MGSRSTSSLLSSTASAVTGPVVTTCRSIGAQIAPALRDEAAYVHICANETIHGVEFLADPSLPEGDALALRSDATRFFRFPPDRPRNSADLP